MEDRYTKTRKKLNNYVHHNYSLSDKEIIELLDIEIEEYRDRIRQQQKELDELNQGIIKGEVVELDDTEEIIDKDIIEIITNTIYADGKPVETKMKYKYKDVSETIVHNKYNDNSKELKAIYHAEIYETNDGTTEIIYECDKDKCMECTKKNCSKEYCTHTVDKKYAKNFINNI